VAIARSSKKEWVIDNVVIIPGAVILAAVISLWAFHFDRIPPFDFSVGAVT